MTVSFDAVSEGFLDELSATSSLTFSHTCGAGSGRHLMIALVFDDNTNGIGAVSSITYNAVTVPAIDYGFGSGIGGPVGPSPFDYIYAGQLANPSSGAHNIVITFSSPRTCLAMAMSFADTNGSVKGVTTDTFAALVDSSGTNATGAETTSSVNDLIAAFAFARSGSPISPGTGLTDRLQVTHTGGLLGEVTYIGSAETKAAAASSTITSITKASSTGGFYLEQATIVQAASAEDMTMQAML